MCNLTAVHNSSVGVDYGKLEPVVNDRLRGPIVKRHCGLSNALLEPLAAAKYAQSIL